jgi:transposase-like protein
MRQAVEELKVEGTLPREVELHSNAYLNNIIEQDHRRVKQWVEPMLGFKRFDHAAIILAGIELTPKLRKGQFNFSKLIKRSALSSDPWWAALVA